MPEQFPEIQWIAPEDNPWNVRLLDLRPVTQGMISTSSDPQCAANALSFHHDDGSSFIAMNPNSTRTVPVDLRYRIAHPFPDGALFIPACMEEKWAIFYRSGQILFVRSWTRELYARAAVEIRGEEMQITAIQGDLVEENEPPGYKERIADYLDSQPCPESGLSGPTGQCRGTTQHHGDVVLSGIWSSGSICHAGRNSVQRP